MNKKLLTALLALSLIVFGAPGAAEEPAAEPVSFELTQLGGGTLAMEDLR